MYFITQIFTFVGLSFNTIGTYILIKPLFLTDEEINQLSELPIEETTSNMTTKSGINSPVLAVPDFSSVKNFKSLVIKERKHARQKGINGLKCIIAGFIIQGLVILFDIFSGLF